MRFGLLLTGLLLCMATSAFAVTAGVPASLTVPVADADGGYPVSWGASATTGASYLLQEATNPTFTANARTAYTGTGLSVTIAGRAQNTTYYYRVKAQRSGYTDSGWRTGVAGCAIPGTAVAAAPASLTVPAADADGAYTISWGASATAGASYELQEATNSQFTTGLRSAYSGTALSASITGRAQNVTYYYRVRAVKGGLKDSGYRAAANSCAIPGTAVAVAPASLTVPAADADGAYAVSWGASATAGASYELQEATNSQFTTGLRNAYSGTALSVNITGRAQNVTYYYRVRAVKGGLKDSGYRAAANSCAIPGTAVAAAPASLTVPAADTDGAYAVSWGASATAGASYELQEATNSLFTTGLRSAYSGTALSVNITGRAQNVTYYYRVRAVKGGLKDSVYRAAANSCAIPGTAQVAAPVSLTVPAADADGTYAVSWGASATAGVSYLLQEATNSLFTTGLRTAYSGTALSVNITGRAQNVTYYYRVRAMKGGLKDSGYRAAANGCQVTQVVKTLTGLTISGGTTVNEGGTLALTSTATWSDSSTSIVTGSATWSDNSAATTVVAGTVTAGQVTASTPVTITAQYTFGGVAKSDTHSITVNNVVTLADYAGTYVGTFDPETYGQITVAADGIISGQAINVFNETYTLAGTVNLSGNVTGTATLGETTKTFSGTGSPAQMSLRLAEAAEASPFAKLPAGNYAVAKAGSFFGTDPNGTEFDLSVAENGAITGQVDNDDDIGEMDPDAYIEWQVSGFVDNAGKVYAVAAPQQAWSSNEIVTGSFVDNNSIALTSTKANAEPSNVTVLRYGTTVDVNFAITPPAGVSATGFTLTTLAGSVPASTGSAMATIRNERVSTVVALQPGRDFGLMNVVVVDQVEPPVYRSAYADWRGLENTVEISPRTTAVGMVFISPYFMTSDIERAAELLPIIENDPKVAILATVIGQVFNEADPFANSAFTTALQDAVASVFESLPDVGTPAAAMASMPLTPEGGVYYAGPENPRFVWFKDHFALDHYLRIETPGGGIDWIGNVSQLDESQFEGWQDLETKASSNRTVYVDEPGVNLGRVIAKADSFTSYVDVLGRAMNAIFEAAAEPTVNSIPVSSEDHGVYLVRAYSGAFGLGSDTGELSFMTASVPEARKTWQEALVTNLVSAALDAAGAFIKFDNMPIGDVTKTIYVDSVKAISLWPSLPSSGDLQQLAWDIYDDIIKSLPSNETLATTFLSKVAAKTFLANMNVLSKVAAGGQVFHRIYNLSLSATPMETMVTVVGNPFPPKSVTATAVSATSAQVSWQPDSGADSFYVYYTDQASPDPANLALSYWHKSPPTVSSYSTTIIEGLNPGTTYSFVVTSVKYDGTNYTTPSESKPSEMVIGVTDTLPSYLGMAVIDSVLHIGDTTNIIIFRDSIDNILSNSEFTFTHDQPVISISPGGTIAGIEGGQTTVTATHKITNEVVSMEVAVAGVTIDSQSCTLARESCDYDENGQATFCIRIYNANWSGAVYGPVQATVGGYFGAYFSPNSQWHQGYNDSGLPYSYRATGDPSFTTWSLVVENAAAWTSYYTPSPELGIEIGISTLIGSETISSDMMTCW